MKYLVAALASALALTACSASSDRAEHVGAQAQPIIHGALSDARQDAVVLLLRTEQGKLASSCTGTFIAPNLVLTARHCVSQTDESAQCDEKGNAVVGGSAGSNYEPTDLFVVTGPTVDWANPNAVAQGKRIFHDGSSVLCNHDVALVLLSRDVPGARIAPIRLDSLPSVGEKITAIGWGLVEGGESPSHRMTRASIPVVAPGPSADYGIGSSEFVIGEGICSGDSGGPAIAPSGAITGVVSRGGNGRKSAGDRSAGCVGTDTKNTYSALPGFKSVILSAFSASGHSPWIEGEPDPSLAKFGDTCADGSACGSGLCLAVDNTVSSGVCTVACGDSSCPDGYDCAQIGDSTTPNVCRPKSAAQSASTSAPDDGQLGVPTSSSGCAIAPARSSGSIPAIFALLLALAISARRRT